MVDGGYATHLENVCVRSTHSQESKLSPANVSHVVNKLRETYLPSGGNNKNQKSMKNKSRKICGNLHKETMLLYLDNIVNISNMSRNNNHLCVRDFKRI